MSLELSQPNHSDARSDDAEALTTSIPDDGLNEILSAWNMLDLDRAVQEILPCCGSRAWARAMAQDRPFDSTAALQKASDDIWLRLSILDWDEAFATHPRIGAASPASSQSAAWSNDEQKAVAKADADILDQLAHANAIYEERFGRTYIVFATGKSAEQMLAILQERLQNSDEQELREAIEQQRQITQIRLKKWLQI